MTSEFRTWIDRLRARYGAVRHIAAKIGMTESGFARGIKRGTLSVENLLDLAILLEEPPLKVLRAAGKTRAADLIEQLFDGGGQHLTASQRELIDVWAALEDEGRAFHLPQLQREARLVAQARAHGTTASAVPPGALVTPLGRPRRRAR
jgi:hypothetical protein